MSAKDPLADLVNGKNMKLQKNVQPTTDRFGNANSALAFNHGFTWLPSGVYFDPATGGFTIMLWIRLLSFNYTQEVIHFGNGIYTNTIELRFQDKTFNFCFEHHCYHIKSNLAYKWTHYTCVYHASSGEIRMYINSQLIYKRSLHDNDKKGFKKIVRGSNFVGYSNADWRFLHAELNELKIFNRGLSEVEIKKEMNKNNYPVIWSLLVFTSCSENSSSKSDEIDIQLIGGQLKSQQIQLDYEQNKNTGRFQTGSIYQSHLVTAEIGIPEYVVFSARVNDVLLNWRLYKVSSGTDLITLLLMNSCYSYCFIYKGNSQEPSHKLHILVLSTG